MNMTVNVRIIYQTRGVVQLDHIKWYQKTKSSVPDFIQIRYFDC